MEIQEIAKEIQSCQKCVLHANRIKPVPGVGPSKVDIMCVGEAPGQQEDLSGLPFVGPSGNLLTRLLQDKGIDRDSVFITNVVKCRPPENRNPKPKEIRACSGYLRHQVEALQPKVIITFGKFATQTMTHQFGQISTIMQISNLVCELVNPPIPVVPCYHPRFLLSKLQGIGRDVDYAKKIYQGYMDSFQKALDIVSGKPTHEDEIDLSFL